MSWTASSCNCARWEQFHTRIHYDFPFWCVSSVFSVDSEDPPSLGSWCFTRSFSPSSTLGQYWIVCCCSREICSVWTFGPAAGTRLCGIFLSGLHWIVALRLHLRIVLWALISLSGFLFTWWSPNMYICLCMYALRCVHSYAKIHMLLWNKW